MTLRNWWKLFWSTLWIGAGSALLIGLILALSDPEFRAYSAPEIGYNLFVMILAGFMFSILSQMGFFAYMMLNYIARDIFRKPSTWVMVQLFFIITVPFEIWFFLWGGSLVPFLIGVTAIFIISVATAYWKVQMTNPSAWIPTLFFMFIATMLETAIAIQINNASAAILMGIPLLACNAWQILKLHTLLKPKES